MAAAYAAISANNGVGTLSSSQLDGITPRGPCTKKLPPESSWIKSGVLYKRVQGNNNPWQPRRVVMTSEYLCVTRQDSNDVIERFELLFVQGITQHVQMEDKELKNLDRRGSNVSVEMVLKKSGSRPQEAPDQDKPAFQFKVVDQNEQKRRFCFGATTPGEVREWMEVLKTSVKQAEDRVMRQNMCKYVQVRLKKFYDSPIMQSCIAVLILGNFAMAICKAQLVPEESSPTAKLLDDMELFFTALFTVELAINIAANWFLPFWCDWWNVFDFIIVTISIIAIPMSDVKGFSLLRMMRVFRVVRLFQSLKSLKNIITALTSAVIPVANAFVVLAVATAIYAVIGVGLYGGEDVDPDQFGDFKRAIFTMFQVITGDSWATTIARPMFGEGQAPSTSVTLFFASYILIVGTFLLNVVVAVLLDEFISSVQIGKAEARKRNLNQKKTECCLDPLLVSFGTCENSKSLSAMIKAVYQVLDADDSGGLSFEEFRDGLQRLETQPIIYLSPENFDEITEGHSLCDFKGELDLMGFERVIRHQLKQYTQRRATFEMVEADQSNSAVSAVLLMCKQIILDLEQARGFGSISRVDSLPTGGAAPARRTGSTASRAAEDRFILRTGSAASAGGSNPAENGERAKEELSGQMELSTMLKMDKKLSRLYGKVHSLVDTMAADGGKSKRGSRGMSRTRADQGDDRSEYEGGRRGSDYEGAHVLHVEDREGWEDEGSGRSAERTRAEREQQGKSAERRQRRSTDVRERDERAERRKGQGRDGEAWDANPEAWEKGAKAATLEAVMARLDSMDRRLGELGREQRGLSERVAQSSERLERRLDTLLRDGKDAFLRAPSGASASASGQLAGIGPSDGSWKAEQRALNEVEAFVGASATQLLLGGLARSSPKAPQRKGNSSPLSSFSRLLSPKARRRQSTARDEGSAAEVTGELTFDRKGGRMVDGSDREAPERPLPFGAECGEATAVRVSWLCSPALSPLPLEPPVAPLCQGCRHCHAGYIGVGCLLLGERAVMVANTEELLGNEHQVAGPDVLAVMGQGLLRRHGHADKLVNPSKFVDTPHGDGHHWFRCYLLLGLSPSLNPSIPQSRRPSEPLPPSQDSQHPPPAPRRRGAYG